MTTRCGGGTSAAQPAYTAIVDITTQAIAAVLAARGLKWIIPALPLLNVPPLVLASFCATDPPANPTFTTAETTALLQLQFGSDFDSGLSKLADMVLSQMWDQFCHCTSGALTAPPTVTQPANTPVPTAPAANPVVACGMTTEVAHNWNSGQTNFLNYIGTNPAVMGATSIQITLVNSPSPGPGAAVTYTLYQNDKAGTHLRSDVVVEGATANDVVSFPVTPGCEGVQLLLSVGGSGQTESIMRTIELFCAGAIPGGTQSPCCPPDDTTAATLDIILRLVTLMQRQSVPFGYVPGTVHTGLSGAGTLAISGLIGASVEATTIPARYGQAGSAPTEYFDMGFLTFGTPDGYPSSYRMDRSKRLLLPARCGAYTELDYDLASGVVITVTELLREP